MPNRIAKPLRPFTRKTIATMNAMHARIPKNTVTGVKAASTPPGSSGVERQRVDLRRSRYREVVA